MFKKLKSCFYEWRIKRYIGTFRRFFFIIGYDFAGITDETFLEYIYKTAGMIDRYQRSNSCRFIETAIKAAKEEGRFIGKE